MATYDEITDSVHFAMLDELDTITEKGISTQCPSVQIIDSSNKYSLQNVEAIKNRIENNLKLEEENEDLFTISLNTAEDYKNQLFR